ncbi:MAG: hypothetical protein EPN60_04220 [Nevskiaceae bacterium]|nr:MAG: hypothetical protein EPO48_06680 [Nevskiaceae bacterium]TAM31691.1 MAG: hypothetical protein EPN60_04220 [Nevskiaceae bacterium]
MPRAFHLLLLSMLASAGTATAATTDPLQPLPAIISYRQALPPGIASELNLLRVPEGVVASGVVLPSIRSVALTAPRALLELIARDPRVLAVRPQRRLKLDLYGSVAQMNARGVEIAEEVGPKGCAVERPGVTGAGVTVAVIDSGIFSAHPALLGRVTAGRNFEFSQLQRQSGGVLTAEEWDQYAEATGPSALQDEVGHGTHCAGIIGGDGTGASGLDLRGVAPGVNLVSLKIASAANGIVEDIGFEANAVMAIDYLVRHREDLGNVRVASNSWGLLEEEFQAPLLGPTDFDPVKLAVQNAVAENIVMVFAAGNDGGGPDQDTLRPVPTAMEEVITVASACKADHGSCESGHVNSFTSRGNGVDIAAPGDQILATMSPASVLAPLGQATEGDYFGDSPQDQVQNRAFYMRLSGTSMAAPHIAGVAALLLEAAPELSPAQLRELLVSTATDMAVEGDPELVAGYDKASGYGLVNVRKALAASVGAPLGDVCPSSTPVPGDPSPTASSGGGASGGATLLLLGALAALRRYRQPRKLQLH